MSKLISVVVAVIVCTFVCRTWCYPLDEEIPADSLVRQKRVTCDLLSFEIPALKLNHAACAAHCLTLKRKGGSCKNGVCVCRN